MKFTLIVILLTLAIASYGAAPVKRPVAKKKASSAHVSATGTSSKKRSKKGAGTAPRQMTQQTPSPERYKEIQQALVAKGYLKSEPTGVWDSQSADALKQFQTENSLSPTGKLSSASLIGLGLGAQAQSASTPLPNSPATPPPIR